MNLEYRTSHASFANPIVTKAGFIYSMSVNLVKIGDTGNQKQPLIEKACVFKTQTNRQAAKLARLSESRFLKITRHSCFHKPTSYAADIRGWSVGRQNAFRTFFRRENFLGNPCYGSHGQVNLLFAI
jgi:hypothetical protein